MTTQEKQTRFNRLEEVRVSSLMEIERLQAELEVTTSETQKNKLDVSIDWNWSEIDNAMQLQRDI